MSSDPRMPIAPPDIHAAEPIYRQIYDRFVSAIATGLLKPGDRIPSTRALTEELGLARGTVQEAYALLAAEGYIQPRGQAGTIVTPGLKPRIAVAAEKMRPRGEPATPGFRSDPVLPFQMGLPALDEFPRKIWARLTARCARAMQPADMTHPPVSGLPELRAAIATYLHVSRGIHCAASQVFVTSGYRQTIELMSLALMKSGDRVWLEDPGYPPTRQILAHRHMEFVPVPVDRDGVVVSEGIRLAPHARAAVVTPAHQSPFGISLSLPRRMELLDWAARNSAWIIEDDYDGEYRYVSHPLPALKSLDRDGRVIYSGTFSKVLFPAIRLAYVVVPEMQVAHFEQVTQAFSAGNPQLTQAIVTAFIAEGHFARHIQKMRKLYAARREFTRAGLEKILGDRIRIDAQPGGMHLILRLNMPRSDRRLVELMRAEGLSAQALTDWTAHGGGEPALMVNFTNIASQAVAESLAQRLLKLL